MSHFAVLVAADNTAQLKERLQPFHEYECTGIKDQHVVFVSADESMEELQKEFQESSYDDFSEFMSDYCGYEYSDGDWGKFTNPNKKMGLVGCRREMVRIIARLQLCR
jgi:hypothetical protein